jgi:hypothetical protein
MQTRRSFGIRDEQALHDGLNTPNEGGMKVHELDYGHEWHACAATWSVVHGYAITRLIPQIWYSGRLRTTSPAREPASRRVPLARVVEKRAELVLCRERAPRNDHRIAARRCEHDRARAFVYRRDLVPST